MGWSSDPESKGIGFDSRLAQIFFSMCLVMSGSLFHIFPHVWITLGTLFGHVGVPLWSFLEHVGRCFGTLWGGFDKCPHAGYDTGVRVHNGAIWLTRNVY